MSASTANGREKEGVAATLEGVGVLSTMRAMETAVSDETPKITGAMEMAALFAKGFHGRNEESSI